MQIDRFRNADMTDINSKYLEQEIFDDEKDVEVSDESSRRQLDSHDDVLSRKIHRQRRSIETSDNKKMSTAKSSQFSSEIDTDFLSELNCGLTQCTFISCVIGPLAKKEYTLFKIKSRLWVRTLNEIQRNDIEISSKLVSRVTKLPYGVNPSYLGYQTHVVTTQVGTNLHSNTQHTTVSHNVLFCIQTKLSNYKIPFQVLAHDVPVSGAIPMWILILAILAGFLFLSLLTFILYKLGFFQRKRPEDYDYQGTIQV